MTYEHMVDEVNRIARAIDCTGVPADPNNRHAPTDVLNMVWGLRQIADDLEQAFLAEAKPARRELYARLENGRTGKKKVQP